MNWPDRVMFIYMFLACLLLGGIAVDYHHVEQCSIRRTHAKQLLRVCLIYTTLLLLLKTIVVALQSPYKTETLRKCKQDRLIGFGLIILTAFAPRIMVYGLDTRTAILYEDIDNITLSLVICSVSYFLFAFGMESNIKWDETKNVKLYYVLDILTHGVLIFSICYAFKYDAARGRMKKVLYQLFYHFLCMFSVREFCGVFNGSMRLKKKEEKKQETSLESVGIEKPKTLDGVKKERRERREAENVNDDNKPECKICMENYNCTTKKPQILTRCGHTVCCKCTDSLRDEHGIITCPFCQMKTGRADVIKTNYALMETI